MEKDKAYLDSWLWVPKSKVSKLIKNSLVLEVSGKELRLWRETEHHIGVPRHYFQPDELFNVEVIDQRKKEFPKAGIRSLVKLDYGAPCGFQHDAFADLLEGDGILHMACGKGKTAIFLHLIAHFNVPTVVINDKIHILHQWKGEILGVPEEGQEPKLELDGEVGWIQGPPKKWKWKDCPIVLASLSTLSRRASEVPQELIDRVGLVIWDECHHLPAPSYLNSSTIFEGRRYGCSATVYREDGGEVCFFGHIGPILHENLEQDLIPDVVVIKSETSIDLRYPEVRKQVVAKDGEVHHRMLAAYVGQLPEEITFAMKVINSAVERGRDILAITLSKEHADTLHEIYPDSCVIHGGVEATSRGGLFRSHKLTFATVDSAAEAMNKIQLDCLIILTEFKSKIWFTQSIGRTQRACKEANPPVVLLLWHHRIPMLRQMGEALQRKFEQLGYPVRSV